MRRCALRQTAAGYDGGTRLRNARARTGAFGLTNRADLAPWAYPTNLAWSVWPMWPIRRGLACCPTCCPVNTPAPANCRFVVLCNIVVIRSPVRQGLPVHTTQGKEQGKNTVRCGRMVPTRPWRPLGLLKRPSVVSRISNPYAFQGLTAAHTVLRFRCRSHFRCEASVLLTVKGFSRA